MNFDMCQIFGYKIFKFKQSCMYAFYLTGASSAWVSRFLGTHRFWEDGSRNPSIFDKTLYEDGDQQI